MSKKSILKEAIADANEIKAAAYKNANSVLSEHLKDSVKQFVDTQLNTNQTLLEMKEEDDDMDVYEEESNPLAEAEDEGMEYDEDTDFDMDDEEDEDELDLDDEDDDDDGLSELDLEEALHAALAEVDHPGYGEMEEVDPDKRAKSRGLMDQVDKEEGWEEKEPKKSSNPEVYGGGTYHESLQRKVAKLVKENTLLKKANSKLSEALEDVKLFNAKVLYTSKLLQKEGLDRRVKARIMEDMDQVGSLREAKQTYKTWNTALGVLSEQRKSAPARKRPTLSEALGSSSGKGVSQVDDSHLLTESDNPFSQTRLQVLAGLKGKE